MTSVSSNFSSASLILAKSYLRTRPIRTEGMTRERVQLPRQRREMLSFLAVCSGVSSSAEVLFDGGGVGLVAMVCHHALSVIGPHLSSR